MRIPGNHGIEEGGILRNLDLLSADGILIIHSTKARSWIAGIARISHGHNGENDIRAKFLP